MFTLMSRADEWDRNLVWLDDPDEISLEIIPPTGSAAPQHTMPDEAAELASQWADPSTQCRALAYLAGQLLTALRAS